MHFALKAIIVVIVAFVTSSIYSDTAASVRMPDQWGNTPLHWAAKGGALQSIGILLKAGADPLAANNAGSTPLHWACTAGSTSSGTASDERLRVDSWAATAAERTLRAVLGLTDSTDHAAGENAGTAGEGAARLAVNVLNNDKESPLHWAVDWQSESAVSFLLSRGANPNPIDIHGNTPLHKIDGNCQNSENCRRIVARLTRAGADITIANSFGRKALDHFDIGKATPVLLPEEERAAE